MAICLEYQSVYCHKTSLVSTWTLTFFATLLLLFALSFKVWIKVESTSRGYELAKEQERAMQMDMQRRDLELQLSVLMRPDHLARRAHTVLGLNALNPRQAVKVVTVK